MTSARFNDLHAFVTRLAVIVILSTLCAAPAAAQVSAGLNELGTEGMFESGRFTPDATEDQSTLAFKLHYGRFISDRVSIGPVFDVFKFEGSPATGSYGGFLDFHFGDTARTVVPYVQGGAGQFFTGDGDAKPVYFAAGPGIKWFLGEGGALNVSALYRHQRFPESIRNSAFAGYNDLVITVGASIYFGR